MKSAKITLLLFFVLFHIGFKPGEQIPPREIPMKDFFRNPAKSAFRISPDGKYFSYRADYKGKLNVFVQPVNSDKAVRVTNDTTRSIFNYFWKGNRILYLQDIGGDENFQLFSVNADGTELKPLTPFPGYRTEIINILKFVPGMEKEILIGLNKRDKQYFDPYLIDIETGKMDLKYQNKENFDTWYTDNDGVIRIATKTDGVNVTYLYRSNEKESFKELVKTSFKDAFYPQYFDKANKNFLVLSNLKGDKVALTEYDPLVKKEVKMLYQNPEFDLSTVNFDQKERKLINVEWSAEKHDLHFFDDKWKEIQQSLEDKQKGYEVRIVDYDDNKNKAIVWSGNDKLPAKYFIYDFRTKDFKEAANAYPWLREDDLADIKPIKFTSRDGLTIHGYLTLPKGIDPKNLPVIVNPHGGPWARDEWGYNPENQFLANRGFAVLQVNFRGSTGYGKKFFQSSFKQWGKKMQDDITDAVEWIKSQGIADPNRIGIYGGSYGGYATLAGITFTPTLYAAAVDYVGVSNLFTFMNTIPPYWKPYLDQLYEMVGHPKKDSLLLASASPALHTDKIQTPLLIAQGANDPRVNKAESDQIVEGLKKRGIEVEYMVKSNEGHGFRNEDNRFDFYGAMEKFFTKYLKEPRTP